MKLISFLLASVTLLPLAAADISIVDNDETITVDCAKDPNVNIAGNTATVTLTGTCSKIMIAGNHITLAGSAATVWIAGNHNTATLDAVDSLVTAGNHNTATYKKTVNPKLRKTKVSNPGNHNTVTRTK
ncbi:MAG: DUF3060 domain-containing protein [Deltaproteobacteria bacterium]|nr:DUF3060 domain-containing protein [Deltaproteobacteria bacterium]